MWPQRPVGGILSDRAVDQLHRAIAKLRAALAMV